MFGLGRDAEIFGQSNDGVYDKIDIFLIDENTESLWQIEITNIQDL